MSDSLKGLDESIARLDALLAQTGDLERLRAGMGVRLALGFARELRQGKALGLETADLVAEWAEAHGQDAVDAAVTIAREFMTKPQELRKALGERLGLDKVE